MKRGRTVAYQEMTKADFLTGMPVKYPGTRTSMDNLLLAENARSDLEGDNEDIDNHTTEEVLLPPLVNRQTGRIVVLSRPSSLSKQGASKLKLLMTQKQKTFSRNQFKSNEVDKHQATLLDGDISVTGWHFELPSNEIDPNHSNSMSAI